MDGWVDAWIVRCFNGLLFALLMKKEFPPQGYGNGGTHGTQ